MGGESEDSTGKELVPGGLRVEVTRSSGLITVVGEPLPPRLLARESGIRYGPLIAPRRPALAALAGFFHERNRGHGA